MITWTFFCDQFKGNQGLLTKHLRRGSSNNMLIIANIFLIFKKYSDLIIPM